MSEKIRSIVFADYRIQNENVPQFRSGFFIVVASVWSEREKRYLGQKNCRGRMVSKGKLPLWVKRIVASIWSERENGHFGSKELLRAYGLKGKNGHLGQKNCREHMV